MTKAYERPKLRAVEAVVVPDRAGRALMLRDGERIAEGAVVIPPHLVPIVVRFDGRSSAEQIALAASRQTGQSIATSVVVGLARELDDALMLESPRFARKRREIVASFTAASVRPAAHAGGAYHAAPAALARFLDEECLSKASSPAPPGDLVALSAPHMDLWRAAVGYGHAYRALSLSLSPAVDTFVLLGTSHAPMRRPFAVCKKSFDTPLGALEPDHEAIADLTRASRFDVHEDEYLHKGEHSLEFQAVFLRHLLGRRKARIVPILCGLGEAQTNARDPSRYSDAESFLVALAELCEERRGKIVLVSGADLAHVGPRFGDASPLDEAERAALATRDKGSIDRATSSDAPGFFAHVAEDLDVRRVCGLGPIYTMLRALPPGARGALLHYEQCVDPEEGSIVSHASLGYYSA